LLIKIFKNFIIYRFISIFLSLYLSIFFKFSLIIFKSLKLVRIFFLNKLTLRNWRCATIIEEHDKWHINHRIEIVKVENSIMICIHILLCWHSKTMLIRDKPSSPTSGLQQQSKINHRKFSRSSHKIEIINKKKNF